MRGTENRQRRLVLAGVFLTTMVGFALEVLNTRLLSVLTWYSLAFLVLAMGLFGLTVGGLQVYFRGAAAWPDTLRLLGRDALWLAIAVPMSCVLLLIVPLRLEAAATTILLFLLFAGILALPFVAVGRVLAAAITRSPYRIGHVYAADLAGGACGAVVVPLLLRGLDAPSAMLLLGAFAAVGSWCFGMAAGTRAPARRSLTVAGVLGVLCLCNASSGSGLVPLWVKGRPESTGWVEVEDWNSHSRVQVSKPAEIPAALWGAGSHCQLPRVVQRGVVIDGDAATPLYYPRESLEELRFLDCDVTNLAHHLRPKGSVAILGVGGSRDIQSALLFDHDRIVGIELNGILVSLLHSGVGKGTGVASHAAVTLVHDEARSYLARTDERYRIIQASLIDTWASTGAGAHALSESGLYTLEAWTLFLDRLEPDGLLTFSRWASAESVRLISLASAALLARGAREPWRHVVLARAGLVTTLLVSPSPLSPHDIDVLDGVAAEKGFAVEVSPAHHGKKRGASPWLEVRNRDELERLTVSPTLDFSPPTDDRPFFFNVVRPRRFWVPAPPAAKTIEGNQVATGALVLSLFASIVLCLGAIVAPLWLRARPRQRVDRTLLAGLAYFILIGIGFMLTEVALLQRLSLVLGHPVYSLVVVLSSLVGASGLGSLISDRLPIWRAPFCYVYALVAASAVLCAGLALPHLAPILASQTELARIGASVGLCVALGLPLGMAFPAGMRRIGRDQQDEMPWLWGMNGMGSVLAGSVAVLVAMEWGFRWVFGAASACYFLLVVAMRLMTRPEDRAREDCSGTDFVSERRT